MTIRFIAICGLLLCPWFNSTIFADDEQDSAKESIRIEVLLVDSIGDISSSEREQLSGKTSKVMKSIEQLTRDGKLKVINHAEMVVVDDLPAMFQLGGTIPIRTGSTRISGGSRSNVYQDVSIGTLINLTAKVAEKDVAVKLDFAKSFVDDQGDDDGDPPPGISQISQRSTLMIRDGNAQVMSGMTARESNGSGQGVMLIVAVERLTQEDSDESSLEDTVIGDVRIEFVPELGTILLRGKSSDVKRVQELIEVIEKIQKLKQQQTEKE